MNKDIQVKLNNFNNRNNRNSIEKILEDIRKLSLFVAIGMIIILILQLVFTIQISIYNANNKRAETVVYRSNKIVFFGDSITDRYDLDKYFKNNNYINQGNGGDTTADLIKRIKTSVFDYEPAKVFVLIGTNDIVHGLNQDQTIDNIEYIVKQIKKNSPNTKIYIESIYPITKDEKELGNKSSAGTRDNSKIKEINKGIKEIAESENITYIDMYKELINDDDELKANYTEDGLHLNDDGYQVVTNILANYL